MTAMQIAAQLDVSGKEIFGDHVTMKVQRAFEHHGQIVVRARVDGDSTSRSFLTP